MSNGRPVDVPWTGGLDRTVGHPGTSLVSEGGMSNGHPLDRWTGQDSGTSLVSQGWDVQRTSMDVHWTGRTVLSGQRILMANLDMSVLAYLGQMLEKGGGYVIGIFPDGLVLSPNSLKLHIYSLLLCSKCLLNNLWEFLRHTYLPATHCAQQGDIGYL